MQNLRSNGSGGVTAPTMSSQRQSDDLQDASDPQNIIK
jgi:hypothetical protein